MYLDSNLITRFRNVMLGNNSYVINTYKNHEGKNKWNVICSAMDWIEVSVNGIQYIDFKHPSQHMRSLNVMQFICALDIIIEGIKQLCRVFQIKYLYTNNKEIFQTEWSDDIYFKHIRAAFGTHPVNLKDLNPSSEMKYYASWSTDKIGKDFTVIMYSNSLEIESYEMNIEIEELFAYTEKRYRLLEKIIVEINKRYDDFRAEKKNIEIRKGKTLNEEVQILLEENKKRYGKYGYHMELKKMNHLLKGYHSNLSFKVEAMMYFLGLTKVIEEIRSNLEKMEINELQTYNFLYPSPATDLNYFYSKILEYLKNPLEINRRKYDLNISILIEEGELPEEVLELNSEELNLFLNIHLARIS